MPQFEIEFKGATRLERLFDDLPKNLELYFDRAGKEVGKRFIRMHKTARLMFPPHLSSSPRPPAAGLTSDPAASGSMLKTFRTRIIKHRKGRAGEITLKMYSLNPVAREHEVGEVKLGKWMAIPFVAAMTGKKGRVLPRLAALRKAKKLKLIRTRKGQVLLAEIQGETGHTRLGPWLFHLVRKITIRPRLWFFKVWRDLGRKECMEMFRQSVTAAMFAARRSAGKK